MKKIYTLIITSLMVILSMIGNKSNAQAFTEVPQTFAPTYYGAAVWADYDKDGFLDFFVNGWKSTGGSTSAPSAYLYHNNGNNTFTEVATTIQPLGAASAAWGDMNNDGFPDLVVGGNAGSSVYSTRVYRNNGNGSFTDIQGGFIGLITPAFAWADLNNDGFQDLIVVGGDAASDGQTKVYLNNKNETFTETSTGMVNLTNGAVATGDLNNDGRVDIVISGRFDSFDYRSAIYINQGGAVFTQLPAALESARYSSLSIYDYSGDGFADILLAGGNNSEVLHTSLYKNINGTDFQFIPTPMTGVIQGSVAWGDMNNDGLSDVLLTGSNVSTGATRVTEIYTNQGNDTFVKFTTFNFDGLRRSTAQWGDYNNDGKLDVLVTGYRNVSDYITKIYTNNTTNANTQPSPPSNLVSNVAGGSAVLSWTAGSDAQTNVNSLTYNVRIGSSPGASDIVTSIANSTNGKRFLPRNGNAGMTESFNISGLDYGTYYWSVQSIDGAFDGSAFAAEQVFVVSDLLTATFQVTSSGQPLAGATVSVGSQQISTNENGIAIFNLAPGSYTYTITHPFHAPFSGNFAIADQSISIPVEMVALPAFDLSFVVTGPQGPVENAQIEIAGEVITTDATGTATLFILAGTHPYYLYAEGFNQIWGEVTVNAITTYPVEAIPIAIQDLPYSEFFTSTTQPIHWLNFDETSTGYSWFFDQGRAIIDSDAAGQGVNVKASLISPPFNTTGLTSAVALTFDHFFNQAGANNTGTVFYSIDGQEWVSLVVFTQVTGTINDFETEEIVLSDVGPLGNEIRFKFSYDDGNNWSEQWMIDEVTVSTIIAYQMTISNLLQPAYSQTPLIHFEPFVFGARGQNTGALAINDVSLNIYDGEGDVANSIIVPFFPVGGQYDFVASPSFMPVTAGSYFFMHHFVAPGIDLSGPPNMAMLRIGITDSIFATDFDETAGGFALADGIFAGNKFKLLTNDDFTSFTIGWNLITTVTSFSADLYSIHPTTQVATLVTHINPIEVNPSSSMQLVTYPLSDEVSLSAGYYALVLRKEGAAQPLISYDGADNGKYWVLNGTILNPVSDAGVGNLMVRMNVGDLGVSITENTAISLQLYPNPITDYAIIKNNASTLIHGDIFDINGKLLRSIDLIPGDNVLSTSDLQNGFYYLKTAKRPLRFIVNR